MKPVPKIKLFELIFHKLNQFEIKHYETISRNYYNINNDKNVAMESTLNMH